MAEAATNRNVNDFGILFVGVSDKLAERKCDGFARLFCVVVSVGSFISFGSCHRVLPAAAAAASKLKILFATFLILLYCSLFGELLLATMRSMHRFRDFIFWILWFVLC